jgi:[protein-PII] uridylyltransferase
MARVFSAAQSVGFLTEDAWAGVLRSVGLPSASSHPLPDELPETVQGRRALLTELLREGDGGVPRLERLSHRGVLSAWLPGWESIRSLGQRDSFHTYTVDGHSLRCAAFAVELARVGGDDPVAASVAAELSLSPSWEGFLLACLLHDIGKGGRGDHSVTGPPLAAEAAAELGEPADVQEDIAFLVREHLLLPDTATRRDLDDTALLERLAEQIGTRQRLQMLYLLTVADSKATGPAVWSPWTVTLVQELFFKVLRLLDGTGASTGEAVDAGALDEAELLQVGQRPPGELLLTMAIAGAAITGTAGAGGLSLELRTTHLPDVEELSVVSPPHRGLLTRLSGVLAIHGITIMSAQLQPLEDGRIARTFHVADQFGGAIPRDGWERVRDDVALALEGRLGLEHRLAVKAARYAPRGVSERQEPTRVVVENAVSEVLTVIEVYAADRVGLLYTIARTLDDLLLDVRLAKVSTLKDRVVDVFYVADLRGDKLVEPDHLREVELAIRFALDRGS